MIYQQYQQEAKRTLAKLETPMQNIEHMASGIITELAEIMDIYKKNLAYKKALDINHVKEEIGDLLWYVANLHTLADKEFNLEQKLNIEKIDSKIELIWKVIKTIQIDLFDLEKINQPIIQLLANLEISEQEVMNIMQTNIDKLKVRYPEKFTEENAINRDLDKENKILNKNENN